ncbi:MAG TPA: translation initiation factor IF-2 [Rubrobacter sp.]|jgi:translation initiation factor IF-2|nr:translation initiation factor IF-2 [Rubrobacter sp.]
MSKRVYEIARELNLESKEVIGRLNDAGVQVKSHSSSVDEPDYERVFGAAANGDVAPNWRTVAQEEEVQEAREEAEHAGHNATIAAAPSEEPASEPKQDRPLKKRRRVVIDASARNRGARTSVPAPHREPERESSETEAKKPDSDAVQVEPGATVKDLGEAIGVPPTQIIKILMGLGEMKTLTQTLSTEEIELISEELGIEVEIGAVEDLAPAEMAPDDAPEELVEKPPVVTVMGHVDHGKTSLLDRIRQANVQSGEAGGITQHIGAYQVAVGDGGKRISFIDTPGHEAFTEMRARGAKVTDIVVLVVAADDGIMPQTLEAIEHARAAGVPLVVAVNKIDVPNANQDRVFGELSERGLVPEVYGGDTITVPVSAKTGEGIDELLENILVVAELEDLKANPKAPASGYVIEGERDPGRGPVATLLLSRGTLNKGDAVLAGTAYGRVRAMLDYTGKRVKDAGPGTPVEILGLSGVPEAGTRFEVLDHERLARDRAQQAEAASRRQELAQGGTRRTLEELLGEGGTQDLNLVVKADVAGSVEALKEALAKLSTEEVRVNIVRSGVGALTDSDVMLASASDGILLGFNVRPTNPAKQVAEREGVEIRTYDVIYKALEDIEAAMRGMLAPDIQERETGTAEVRQTFRVPNAGVVAGCMVTSGEIFRNNRVRVVREGSIVYEGSIASLKRFRDDARSVREGFECGVGVENFNDLKEGDVLEFFETIEVTR